jgi:hypothetical protein
MPSLAEQAQLIASLYQPPETGRHSDIGSQTTVQQFLEAVGDGNYIETAAKLAGLSKQSVYEWIKRGQQAETPAEAAFKVFADAVEKAEARAEAKMLANVRRASELPQFWAAGMTVLERRHPDRWGKRQDDSNTPKVVVNIGVGQGDVKVGIALSPPDFRPSIPEADACKSLTGNAFALDSSPITAVMVTEAEACQASSSAPTSSGNGNRAGGSQGDPIPLGGEAPKSVEGLPRQRVSARARRLAAHRKKARRKAQDGAGPAIG